MVNRPPPFQNPVVDTYHTPALRAFLKRFQPDNLSGAVGIGFGLQSSQDGWGPGRVGLHIELGVDIAVVVLVLAIG